MSPLIPVLSKSARPVFRPTPSAGPISITDAMMGGAIVSPPERAATRRPSTTTIHTRSLKFRTELGARLAQARAILGVVIMARFTRTFLVAGVSVLTPGAIGVLKIRGLGVPMSLVQRVPGLNGRAATDTKPSCKLP